MIWLQGPIPANAPRINVVEFVLVLALELLAIGAGYALLRRHFHQDEDE